jgi:hypothetical protein
LGGKSFFARRQQTDWQKGGECMKKYLVHVYEPTVYEVEAINENEAKEKAAALYKREKNTWLIPDKIEVAEVPAA